MTLTILFAFPGPIFWGIVSVVFLFGFFFLLFTESGRGLLESFLIAKKEKKPIYSPKFYFFLGQSGAGKDTQVKKVLSWLSMMNIPFMYVSNGNEIRGINEELGADNFFAQQMKKINDQGKLQPALIPLIFFIRKFMYEYTSDKVIIVNGSPRADEEVVLWQSLITTGYLPNATVINIEVSDEECLNRVKTRTDRPDTLNEGSLKTKLGWYGPVRKMLIKIGNGEVAGFTQKVINGEQVEELVFSELQDFLKNDLELETK